MICASLRALRHRRPGAPLPRRTSRHASQRGMRAAGLVLGIALDAALGDPQRWHPVAGFGRWAGWLEHRTWSDDRDRKSVV